MSNPSPSSNGKGSARRQENLSKVRDNWDSIDWSKGRPVEKPGSPSVWAASSLLCLHYDPHLTPEENDLNEQMQEDDLRPY
jgi:hypothetical protein